MCVGASLLFKFHYTSHVINIFIVVQFVDQYLSLSTMLPGTESLYGLGEHKVSLRLKKLVVLFILCIIYTICTITHQLADYVYIYVVQDALLTLL